MASVAPVRPDGDLSLAFALVATSETPLLLLDDQVRVVAASRSFCRTFDIDPETVDGQSLTTLGAGEWAVPQLTSLLAATIAGFVDVSAYEMDLNRPGHTTRHLVLNARKLDYADNAALRMLLTISDVTAARLADKLKDDLLREKVILLQELQHRVGNSLQIICAVLLQSATRTESNEIRTHLYDAHNRVMSIATLQQQLAASRLGRVELRPYFVALCRSIAASMIHDRNLIKLDVVVDDSICDADVSVSLGLIVTELVINALKHAFPGQRRGEIKVFYHSNGPDWTLSVVDDGIGVALDPRSAKAGLGTSIIEALARQLGATVLVTRANPGTDVSIIHRHAAGNGNAIRQASA